MGLFSFVVEMVSLFDRQREQAQFKERYERSEKRRKASERKRESDSRYTNYAISKGWINPPPVKVRPARARRVRVPRIKV